MFPAFLIQIVIALLLAGLFLWAAEQFPLDDTIRRLIRVVVIVAVCLYLIYILAGLLPAGQYPIVHRR